MIELRTASAAIAAPVFVLPGQAENAITLHFGRGASGQATGFNVYPLRAAAGLWSARVETVRKLAGGYDLVSTQTHYRLHGEERQIYREGTLAEFARKPDFVKQRSSSPSDAETLYDPRFYDYPLKWGMAIDLTTCIGCNACVLACNIENNIPIVGKKQVALNREMLWLRIDTYYSGDANRPRYHHQPVPCMHCENAPCEYVCPVETTLHDHEGLNLQVYNRCIGTRYCSNNCH
ncbi:MAG TPA: 4Fe-4S dicluster domain-containing protein [Verrucomicrobiae bacterium]|nr:4Fe-4S dicluster domain-containing protein [Verrucomicrobiae bacterium]